MQNAQQAKAQALAKLKIASSLLAQVNTCIASALCTLEEEGAYTQHELGSDVCAAVRDEIAQLQELIAQYVN